MTVPSKDVYEVLLKASEFILNGEPEEIASVWATTSAFATQRRKLLPSVSGKPATFFLNMSWGLRETLRESGNATLRDSAVLTAALAISLGLSEPAHKQEAFEILLSPPVANEGVYEALRRRFGLDFGTSV